MSAAAGAMLPDPNAFRGQLIKPGRPGVRRSPQDLERLVRSTPGADHPLRRGGRCHRGGEVRPSQWPAGRGAERRTFLPRLFRRRRRLADRSVPDEGRPGRPGPAYGAGPGRRAARRTRSRDPGVRARGALRHRHPHRGGRSDPRRRDRLDHAQARPLDRPPHLRRSGHRRGRVRPGQCRGELRAVLGGPRGRRQLRDCHRVRVQLRAVGHHGARGTDLLADEAGGRGAPVLPRLGRGGAG